jgi:hypothetical protein
MVLPVLPEMEDCLSGDLSAAALAWWAGGLAVEIGGLVAMIASAIRLGGCRLGGDRDFVQ